MFSLHRDKNRNFKKLINMAKTWSFGYPKQGSTNGGSKKSQQMTKQTPQPSTSKPTGRKCDRCPGGNKNK